MTEAVFLSAEWRNLAMLNYEVDPAVLAPFVPSGTELDRWNGRVYVSLVAFLFLKTKVLGVPIPFHRNFEELNLRFYVRHKSGDEWRRGVVFIKEIVPRWAIATVARVVYNENYHAMPMRHDVRLNGDEGGTVEYGWKPGSTWNSVRVETRGKAESLVEGSEEEFIAEHYWGYAAQKDGGSMEYSVGHPPWRVWQVAKHTLDCDVAALYGDRFASTLGAAPTSVFLAEGSPIVVRKGTRLA